MYSLDVVLLGCPESALPQLRRELDKKQARYTEFSSVPQFLASYPAVREWTGNDAQAPNRSNLFILYVSEAQHIAHMQSLGQSYPVLALIESRVDPSLVFHAMREGASQVVQLPLQADDFNAALDRVALQFGHAASGASVIAVAGASGGCGATIIALNLAYEIAHRQATPCILAELAMQLGALPTYLNIEPLVTIQDLLQDLERQGSYIVRKALTRVGQLDVLTGPHRTIGTRAASAKDVLRIIATLRPMADVVVLDVPCTYDDLFFHALAAADAVVLVGEQKVPSVRALALLRRTLAQEAGIGVQRLVINRYDPKIKGFTSTDLEKVLDVAGLLTIANDYPSVMAAVNNGRPLRLEAPRSRVLADIDELAALVLGRRSQPASANWNVFGKLIGAFGLK
jgi:pilus assembly protein CpaE